MNDHEKDRIAAAFNQLRPDWPTKSIRTLLDRPQLADRPRRDVAVALAWIASETNTHTPARVLEAGPWWRAAGIETTGTARRHTTRDEACARCAQEYTTDPACCDSPTRRRTHNGTPMPPGFHTTKENSQ